MKKENTFKVILITLSLLSCILFYWATDYLVSSFIFPKVLNKSLDQSVVKSQYYSPLLGFTHNDPTIQSEKPILILLGDSVAFGYKHTFNESIQGILQNRLPQYEIINLAGIGYNSIQSYIRFFNFFIKNPNANITNVLWINGPNDIRENMNIEFYIPRPELRQVGSEPCVINLPSTRHKAFFRDPKLNTGTHKYVLTPLLKEYFLDLISLISSPSNLAPLQNLAMIKTCNENVDIFDGQKGLVLLNSKLKDFLKTKKINFLSVLLPYKTYFFNNGLEQNKPVVKELESRSVNAIDTNKLLYPVRENAFLTEPLDSDDHFSVMAHQLIVGEICKQAFAEQCLQ